MAFRFTALVPLLALAVPALAGDAPLADDLCNLAVEGLTLDSPPEDVRRVFLARGWADESTSGPLHPAARKPFQELYFIGSRPPVPPGAPPARPDEFFKLMIIGGVGTGLVYRVADPDPYARVGALCARVSGRFQARNCTGKPEPGRGWGISAQPFPGAASGFCQVNSTALDSRPRLFEVKVGRHPGTPELLRSDGRSPPPR